MTGTTITRGERVDTVEKCGLTPDNLSLDVLLIREHHGPELKQDLQVLFQTRPISEDESQ